MTLDISENAMSGNVTTSISNLNLAQDLFLLNDQLTINNKNIMYWCMIKINKK